MATGNIIKELVREAKREGAAEARAELYDSLLKQNEKNIKYGLGEAFPDCITSDWMAERSKAITEHSQARKAVYIANTALDAEAMARTAGAINPSLVAQAAMASIKITQDIKGELTATIVNASGAPVYNPKTGKVFSLAEYVTSMKTSPEYSILFDAGKGATTTGRPVVNPWKKESFNLTMQGQITRDNPTLAAILKSEAEAR